MNNNNNNKPVIRIKDEQRIRKTKELMEMLNLADRTRREQYLLGASVLDPKNKCSLTSHCFLRCCLKSQLPFAVKLSPAVKAGLLPFLALESLNISHLLYFLG